MVNKETMAVSDIIIGRRFRQKNEQITRLAESIRLVGLLHPLVVNTRGELVAGGRRLAAVRQLGWDEVPVRIINTLDEALAAIKAERDENTCREPLTASEIIEMGNSIEAIENPEAASRRRATQNNDSASSSSGNFPPQDAGKTRDKVGKSLGVSGKTYEKLKFIKENGIPELLAMVDAKQVKVDPAAKVAKLPKDEQKEIVAKGPEAVKKAAKASRQAKQKSKPEPVSQPAAAESASDTPVQQELSKEIEAVCRELDKLKATVESWKERPESYSIHFPTVADGLFRIRQDLWAMRLSHPCPYCETNAKPDCKACRGTRKVTKASHTQGARSMNRYGGVA